MTIERYNYNDEPSGRSETLVQSLERCERLEKQLNIAVEALETIINACEMKVPHQGINPVRPESMFIRSIQNWAQKALRKIKELLK